MPARLVTSVQPEPMEEKRRGAYEFAAFRFDPTERVLYRGASIVPLTPKVAETLLVLLEHHSRVVEKTELLKLVWPDTFVEEGGRILGQLILAAALSQETDHGEIVA